MLDFIFCQLKEKTYSELRFICLKLFQGSGSCLEWLVNVATGRVFEQRNSNIPDKNASFDGHISIL